MTESELIKILWINQQDQTPIDGLGLIESSGQKVWFTRVQKEIYNLYIIDAESLAEIEADHKTLCEKLGYPLYHGDPFVFNKDKKNNKETAEDKMTIYNRVINPKLVSSQYLRKINKSGFSNYLVPHRIA